MDDFETKKKEYLIKFNSPKIEGKSLKIILPLLLFITLGSGFVFSDLSKKKIIREVEIQEQVEKIAKNQGAFNFETEVERQQKMEKKVKNFENEWFEKTENKAIPKKLHKDFSQK
jgi:hypothetical protein